METRGEGEREGEVSGRLEWVAEAEGIEWGAKWEEEEGTGVDEKAGEEAGEASGEQEEEKEGVALERRQVQPQRGDEATGRPASVFSSKVIRFSISHCLQNSAPLLKYLGGDPCKAPPTVTQTGRHNGGFVFIKSPSYVKEKKNKRRCAREVTITVARSALESIKRCGEELTGQLRRIK